MNKGIYPALSGGVAYEKLLSIIANNVANIDTPDGPRYTRSGNFVLDASNALTTVDGHMVMGEGGPVILEEGRIAVDAEGRVSVDGSEINKIKIVDFGKPYLLQKDQNNMFSGSGEETAAGYKVLQGAVELSNVNSVKEMAAMISVLRGYESYQKVMTTLDEASAKANEVGRV